MCIALLYLLLIFVGFNAPLSVTLGVLVGGLLVTLGFHHTCKIVEKALTPPHKLEMGSALVKYYLRFAILVAALTVIIIKQWVHPFGLVVGISVLPLSLILSAAAEFILILYSNR
jgi:cytochrome b subunit of formate dehydrogenase